MVIGSVDANVKVELPRALTLAISAKDGDVELSGIKAQKFSISTEDGDVVLNNVANAGKSEVTTEDGDVEIFGALAKLGRIGTQVRGDGKVDGFGSYNPAGGGELWISTADGDISAH